MLRVSTLTAWAELEVASAREEYLQNVLKPFRGTLALLWVSALRDYASIRADSEAQQDGISGMDASYTGLGRETLLPVSTCVIKAIPSSNARSTVLYRVVGEDTGCRWLCYESR